VTRLALGPLTEADIAELLPDLPARRRRLMLRASGGNPLYVDALDSVDDSTLEVLADQDRADPRDMPGRLHALLATELRWLDPVQRLVAQAIAIAGDPAELDLVLSIAGRPEDEVFPALDALVANGVVHPAGSRFRFRHPLLRLAAYQSAGPAWRIGAHRRAGAHLRSHGGPLPLRAHHLSRAASYGHGRGRCSCPGRGRRTGHRTGQRGRVDAHRASAAAAGHRRSEADRPAAGAGRSVGPR
jgi:predicted ATPase